jgi:signal transduction histidine kinase
MTAFNLKRRKIYSYIFLFLSYSSLFSQQTLHFKNEKEPTVIGQYSAVKQDIDGSLTIEKLLTDSSFAQNTERYFMVGGRNGTNFWMKYDIQNNEENKAYLELLFAHIDTATLYTVEDNKVVKVQRAGQKMLKENRPLNIHNFVFEIAPSPKVVTYYLNMKVRWPCKLNMRIGSSDALYTHYYRDGIIQGAFGGIMFIIALYSFFLYFFLKNVLHVYYCFYLLLCGLSVIQLNGFFIEELFRSPPQLNDLTMMFPGLSGIMGLLFVMSLLQSKKRMPFMHKGFQFFVAFYSLQSVLALTRYQESINTLSIIIIPIASIWGIVAAVLAWRQGSKIAQFLFYGLIPYYIGLIIFVLDSAGVIPYNIWTPYALQMGLSLEAVILAMAIANRFRLIQERREASKLAMIKALEDNERILNEHNSILERRVEESKVALKEYAQKLEKSNRELTDFAHVASHDLKAPIRGILSFSQLFERRNKDKFDDTDREFFNYIKTNAAYSSRLIEDLLNYSKIDKNLDELETIDLNKSLNLMKMNLLSVSTDKNIHFEIQNMPILRGHRTLVTQLFQNLINNGLKYNKNEQPMVTIGCEMNKRGVQHFFIKDNGIGIAAEHQERIFSMFHRLHNQTEYEGTGIGLAFCKRIVQIYGGTIWVESEEGKGSTFHFSLPNAFCEDVAFSTNEVGEFVGNERFAVNV